MERAGWWLSGLAIGACALLVGVGLSGPVPGWAVATLAALAGVACAGAALLMRSRLLALQARLRRQQAPEWHLKAVLDNVPARISHFDLDQRVLFANRACGLMFGCEASQLVGRTIREVRGDAAYEQIREHVEQALRGEPVRYEQALQVDGQVRHYVQEYLPERDDDGRVLGFYSLSFDITEERRARSALYELARHDVLTGLPNRRAFEERLGEAMDRCRVDGATMAVFFIDIDLFKAINDQHGHAVGDDVLKDVALALHTVVPDAAMVARIAGDEFVVILEGLAERDGEPAVTAERLVAAVRPLRVAGGVPVSVSIGCAVYDGDERGMNTLMAEADDGLYAAKRAGRDTWHLSRVGRTEPGRMPSHA